MTLQAIPSDNIKASDDSEHSTASASYVLTNSFHPPENISGTFRFTYDLKAASGEKVYGIIKKNGIQISIEQILTSPGFFYVTETEDISTILNTTDTLELYIHGTGAVYVYSRNFRLKYDVINIIDIPKELTYKVYATQPAKTKTLQYRILNSPRPAITKELKYNLNVGKDLTKQLQYKTYAHILISKKLKYVVASFPNPPYVIYGRVLRNNIELPNTTVTIEDITKGSSGTRTTDASGYYLFDDLVQLTPGGYTEGDLIRVGISFPENYSITFIAADSPEEKLVNLNYWRSYNMTVLLGSKVGIIQMTAASPNMTGIVMIDGKVGVLETHEIIG